MTEDVKRIIDKMLEHEGGYNLDPDDPGGETKFGISRRQYPRLDIKNLTRQQAIDIYERDYYRPMHLDGIDSIRIRYKVFDIGVNCGPCTAVKMLQRVAGVNPVDGIIGPVTAGAVNVMDNELVLAGVVRELKKHYEEIVEENSKAEKYLEGWLRRAEDTGESL